MNYLHELLTQAGVLQFPVKLPEAISCNSPLNVQLFDMELSSATVRSDPSNFGFTTYYPHAVLLTSGLMHDEYAFYDDQLIASLYSPFNQGTRAVLLLQGDLLESLGEADVSLNLFHDFRVNLHSELEPIPDDALFSDYSCHHIPPMEETDRANRSAHLEMLKQQQKYLQERILLLEEQISAPA